MAGFTLGKSTSLAFKMLSILMVVSYRILRKLWFKFHFAFGKMVTLTSMVSNSGYKIERVSLLSFAVLTRLSTQKNIAGALFCCLIYHSRQRMGTHQLLSN
jgi:hypothetical protein